MLLEALALMLMAALPQEEAALASGGRKVDAAVAAFARQAARNQPRILDAVRAAVAAVDDPYLRSVRAYIEKGRKKPRPRRKTMPRKAQWAEAIGGDHPLADGLPFPVANRYVFGVGAVVAAEASSDKKKKKKRPTGRFPFAAQPADELRAMLLGYLPDLDLALAALLRELDADRKADRFSTFLEAWRNGRESFYRALDRTAGTEDRVFFYDAMLSDYIRLFVPKSHPDYKRIRRSDRAAHDALHEAFLSYRQYRAMRECAALGLLLPPGTELPGVLDRYEAADRKAYSFRQQVDLLLASFDQDLGKVVALIVAAAPPLPEALWTRRYDPWKPFNEAYDARLPGLIAGAGDTDKALARQRAGRRAVQRRVAAAAARALRAAGVDFD